MLEQWNNSSGEEEVDFERRDRDTRIGNSETYSDAKKIHELYRCMKIEEAKRHRPYVFRQIY